MDFVLLHDFDLCLHDLRLCLSALRGPNQVTDFYQKKNAKIRGGIYPKHCVCGTYLGSTYKSYSTIIQPGGCNLQLRRSLLVALA